jgi:hypothetical protein
MPRRRMGMVGAPQDGSGMVGHLGPLATITQLGIAQRTTVVKRTTEAVDRSRRFQQRPPSLPARTLRCARYGLRTSNTVVI